jgi:hypothetical protein
MGIAVVFGCLLVALAVRSGYTSLATAELAMHGSTRVNVDRKAKGEPMYTVVPVRTGMEWPLGKR